MTLTRSDFETGYAFTGAYSRKAAIRAALDSERGAVHFRADGCAVHYRWEDARLKQKTYKQVSVNWSLESN